MCAAAPKMPGIIGQHPVIDTRPAGQLGVVVWKTKHENMASKFALFRLLSYDAYSDMRTHAGTSAMGHLASRKNVRKTGFN